MADQITISDEARSSVSLVDRFGQATVNVTTLSQTVAEETVEAATLLESIRIEGPAALGLSTLGWRFYQDSHATDDSPLILPGNVRMQLPIDGEGLLSSNAGCDSTGWLDPMTAKFQVDALGDFFIYRVNLTVWPSVNFKTFTIDFDIGTANRVFELPIVLSHGAGYPHKLSVTMPLSGGAGWVANGGTINVTYEADAKISRVSVLALKSFSAVG